MNISESCAKCMYDKQARKTKDPAYLAEIRKALENRSEHDTAPYMVYLFNQIHEKHFGKTKLYEEEKKMFNDLALSMENAVRKKIEASSDPLSAAIAFSRAGNYVDFGAMNDVSEEKFLELIGSPELSERDMDAYRAFRFQCGRAKRFLLLADNCGEIVFDKLLFEQLHKRFPAMKLSILVRGGDVLNDVTEEDAKYVGLEDIVEVISSGEAIAGTIYERLPKKAKDYIDQADVILSKGQGNYESFSPSGRHAFYLLLCKCDLFTNRFHVPKLTGVFVEQGRKNHLSGKTILFLGSSVTYGEAANGISFVDLLADRHGCTVIKEAVSGTTLVDEGPESYIIRLKKLPKDIKPDLFVCQLSTNDASLGKTPGYVELSEHHPFDTHTVAGAIEYIISYAKKTWGCPVAFFTNPRYESDAYAKMVEMLHKLETKWKIGLINLWNDEEFNSICDSDRKRFMADPIHPTLAGYLEWWLPYFEEALSTMLSPHQ